MSTGLSYVSFGDGFSAAPDVTTGVTAFASYEEAYNYGDWMSRASIAHTTAVHVFIWTSGPNQNGFWYNGIWSTFD